MRQLENLLLFLARSLVDEPEKVEVSGRETDSKVNLTLRVAPKDMGKVIGRQGRIAVHGDAVRGLGRRDSGNERGCKKHCGKRCACACS